MASRASTLPPSRIAELDEPVKPSRSNSLCFGHWTITGRIAILVLVVTCALALGVFFDSRSLLAASRQLSCSSVSVRDSVQPPLTSSRRSAVNSPGASPPNFTSPEAFPGWGFDISVGGLRFPCSTVFRVAPTACDLTLALRGSAAPHHRIPINIVGTASGPSVGGLCGDSTFDASATIPVGWLPPVLRAGMAESAIASDGQSTSFTEVADAVSLSCSYRVDLCLFGAAACTAVSDGTLQHSVPVTLQDVSVRASVSTVDTLSPTSGRALAGDDSSLRVPLLSIPMSSTPDSAFFVAKTVDVDIAGARLDVEACMDCRESDGAHDGTLRGTWAPLYSFDIAGVRTHCSSVVLEGARCTVSLALQVFQHSVPPTWLSSVGAVALPSLVSGLDVLPVPLRRAVMAAFSPAKSASLNDAATHCEFIGGEHARATSMGPICASVTVQSVVIRLSASGSFPALTRRR